MGKNFFNSITRLSIRFKWITIAITIILLGLGIYSALDLKVELLPDIDVPSTFAVAQSNGSTGGNLMLQAYTIPLEEGAGETKTSSIPKLRRRTASCLRSFPTSSG